MPLAIAGPGVRAATTEALASELDLMPTLLDLTGIAVPPGLHGISLRAVLEGRSGAKGRDFASAEISHRGNLPNNGLQERAVWDGRWKLIFREKVDPPWRQVQADSKEWPKWGNRTYAETMRVKEQFPAAFRVLQGLDPQNLGGQVSTLELYDLQTDPDELRNLAGSAAARSERDRLYAALRQWVRDTADPAVGPQPLSVEQDVVHGVPEAAAEPARREAVATLGGLRRGPEREQAAAGVAGRQPPLQLEGSFALLLHDEERLVGLSYRLAAE